VEFRILEELFGPIGPQAFDAIVANLVRCLDIVPADVPAGLHLCYGDYGHQHFKQPESLAQLAVRQDHHGPAALPCTTVVIRPDPMASDGTAVHGREGYQGKPRYL
jgi:hypothetical protein